MTEIEKNVCKRRIKNVNVNYVQRPCLIPKPQFNITRTRSTQWNFIILPSSSVITGLAVAGRYTNDCYYALSGVAGPLAALGGGQICRPFVLGF